MGISGVGIGEVPRRWRQRSRPNHNGTVWALQPGGVAIAGFSLIVVKHVQTLVVDAEFRVAIRGLVERLGPVRVIASDPWDTIAQQCDVTSVDSPDVIAVVVGPPAIVLKHAAITSKEFGFVMPVAHCSRPWQRSASWRDDATLDLWHAGWSPLAIDRVHVATHEAVVEYVIGNARRIPATESLIENR